MLLSRRRQADVKSLGSPVSKQVRSTFVFFSFSSVVAHRYRQWEQGKRRFRTMCACTLVVCASLFVNYLCMQYQQNAQQAGGKAVCPLAWEALGSAEVRLAARPVCV